MVFLTLSPAAGHSCTTQDGRVRVLPGACSRLLGRIRLWAVRLPVDLEQIVLWVVNLRGHRLGRVNDEPMRKEISQDGSECQADH
jgi:hypothetical protein